MPFHQMFSDAGKFITVIPLFLLVLCKLTLSIVSFKVSSLLTLTLKSHNEMFVWYIVIDQTYASVLNKSCPYDITFILSWCRDICNNSITVMAS